MDEKKNYKMYINLSLKFKKGNKKYLGINDKKKSKCDIYLYKNKIWLYIVNYV